LRDLVISVLHRLRQSRTLHTLTFGPISGVHFRLRCVAGGQGDGNQHARLFCHHPPQPGAFRRAASGRPANYGDRANDKHATKIALPHLRDPAEPLFAPGRMLARRKADPGSEVTTLS
jgi:hypothetical protein